MPKLAIIVSGNRPDRWMALYDSIAQSNVDFSLTIAGPKEPVCKMPDNFYYIKTFVKPAQCVEICFRNSESDLVMPTADDLLFIDNAIDNAYKQYCEEATEKDLVSFRYCLKGKDLVDCYLPPAHYYVFRPKSPLAPLAPLMKRKLWKELGGIDRRFIALYWDLDLGMRVYENGGKGIMSPDAKLEEIGECKDGGDHTLFDAYGPPYDRRILDSFWTIPPTGQGQIVNQRLAPVEPFEDKDILTKTQGAKGRWS